MIKMQFFQTSLRGREAEAIQLWPLDCFVARRMLAPRNDRRHVHIRSLLLVIIFFISPSLFAGVDLVGQLSLAETEYQICYEALPTKVRWGIENSNLRGRRRWSAKLNVKVEDCFAKGRMRDDGVAAIQLSKDLQALYKNIPAADKDLMTAEAEDLADLIISTTRGLSKKFDMMPSAYWHNIFIHMGLKEGGFCYHWVDGLLRAMSDKDYKYFERYWGGHNMQSITENNSLIIVPRGKGLESGLMYDAWRGKGRPFWLYVPDDTQDWQVRYNEREILSGATYAE